METKANKVMVDKLAVETGSLEDRVTNLAMDMSKKNWHGQGWIPRKSKRAKIVVRGLPENNEKEGQDLASEIFKDRMSTDRNY